MCIGGLYAAQRSLELITFKISFICGIMEDVGNTHTHRALCGVTDTDRDECVLGNMSDTVRDVAYE